MSPGDPARSQRGGAFSVTRRFRWAELAKPKRNGANRGAVAAGPERSQSGRNVDGGLKKTIKTIVI